MNKIVEVLIIPAIFTIVIFSFMWLIRSSTKAWKILGAVERQARNAITVEEVREAWNELVKTKDICWHREHYHKVTEIKAILETKFQIFSNEIQKEVNNA